MQDDLEITELTGMCQEPIWIGDAMQGKASRGVPFRAKRKARRPSRDTLPAKIFAFLGY